MTREKMIGYAVGTALAIGITYGTVKMTAPATPAPSVPVAVKPTDTTTVTPPAPVKPRDPNVAYVVIESDHPKSASVGDLVTIKVSDTNANNFTWQVIPETANFKVQNGGKEAYLASGNTGQEYLVIVSGAKGDTSDVKTIKVKFLESVVANPSDISGKVAAWAAQVNSPTKRDEVLALSQGFYTLANSAAAGAIQIPDLVKVTAATNRDAVSPNLTAWQPFFTNLAAELKSMATAGKLTDLDSHVKTWRSIGDALKQYAQTL